MRASLNMWESHARVPGPQLSILAPSVATIRTGQSTSRPHSGDIYINREFSTLSSSPAPELNAPSRLSDAPLPLCR